MGNFIPLELLEGRPLHAESGSEYKTIDREFHTKLTDHPGYVFELDSSGNNFVTLRYYTLVKGGTNFKDDAYILIKHQYRYSAKSIMHTTHKESVTFMVQKGRKLLGTLRDALINEAKCYFSFNTYKQLRVVTLRKYKKLTK